MEQAPRTHRADAGLSPAERRSMEQNFEFYLQALDEVTAREYRQAVELAPQLVESESEKWVFIRFEGYNLERAARRRALYWKTRKYLFEERWLLPMTQTGTGTLTSRDVEILRSGYICPVQTRTPHGLILFFDNSRLPPNVPLLQFQVLMYLATIFQGCSGTVVNVVRTGHGSHVQRPAPQFEPDVFCMLSDSLAYKNAGYFVVQAWEYGFEHLLQFLTFQSATVARGNLPDTNPNVVAGNSGGETLRLLEATGFSRDSLPQYLGGTMDRDNVFTDWVRMRVSLETALSTPSPLDTRNSLVPAAIQQWPGESEEDFARRRRAFYSRRKYHKKKLRNLSLEDQVTHARNSNTQLNEENRRLEGLVNQAKQIVENTLLGDAGDKKPPARNS